MVVDPVVSSLQPVVVVVVVVVVAVVVVVVVVVLHPLKRITVLQKKLGFGDIFSFWFFNIKLFSELVVLYFQTFLQKPS